MATTKATKKDNIREIAPAVEPELVETEQADGEEELDKLLKEVKPVIIHDEEHGHDYKLEFDRDSVRFAEDHDFKIDDIEDRQMTRVPELFYFAFRKNHMKMSRQQTDKILFDDLGGATPELVARLSLLYAIPYRTLFNQTGKPKNPRVTMEL